MSAQDTFFYEKNLEIFSHNTEPIVFGILNITPDSFFDGGKYINEKAWLKRVEQMIIEGVDVIDVGAYSTRPGALDVKEEEEVARLIPVLKSIRKEFKNVVISVDTFRSNVAVASVNEGANIINDIGGGTLDDKMFDTIIKLNVPYILMHIQGSPQTMQVNPSYNDVMKEIFSFFQKGVAYFNAQGFNKIIIDPGFGFGKSIDDNFKILSNLNYFSNLNLPIMVGLSRKSMISKILDVKKEDALIGTIILNSIALMKGAKILRVHDVKEAKQTIKLVRKLNMS